MIFLIINPNSLDNKGSWRILKDFYFSVTMLRELGLNFDFLFGQEVKVKLGSPLCKYFLTINDLYNGAKIVN